MTPWAGQLRRGDQSDLWTSKKAARQAAGWAHTYAAWLESDQAALMRTVAEQQLALHWWQNTRGGQPADLGTVMPAWLAEHHGLDVDQTPDSGDGLSPTPRMVQQLCRLRSRQLRGAQLFVCEPSVQALVVGLAQSGAYWQTSPLDLGALPDSGMLLLPHPIKRTGSIEGPSLPGESGRPQPLRAVAWHNEVHGDVPTVRVLDLGDLTGQYGRTGDASFDKRVREGLAQERAQLPPLLFQSELVRQAGPTLVGEQASRARITAAGGEYRQQGQPWDPSTPVDDRDGLLAARLVLVVADMVTAPLVQVAGVEVPNPAGGVAGPVTVQVCTRPE